MKAILVIIFFYLNVISSVSAQIQYSEQYLDVETITENVIYKNIPNSIFIRPVKELDFNIDSIKVVCEGGAVSTISLGMLTLTPDVNSTYCQLHFYFKEKEVGNKVFFLTSLPEPFLYSSQLDDKDERSFYGLILSSQVTISEIKRLKEFELLSILGTGDNAYMFDLNSFEYKILRDEKIIVKGFNKSGVLAEGTIKDFGSLKAGDFLIICNIKCILNGIEKKTINYRLVEIINTN